MTHKPISPEALIDKRGRLDSEPFAYQITKDDRVLIYWQARLIKTVAGGDAHKLIATLVEASAPETQLALAKVTGNFRRGNEHKAAE